MDENELRTSERVELLKLRQYKTDSEIYMRELESDLVNIGRRCAVMKTTIASLVRENETMKKAKTNPRRRPASEADVRRAKERATASAIVLTKALVFTALLDEGIIQPDDVKRGWEKTKYLADSTKRGYITVQDMYNTLVAEYGVDLGGD